MERIARRGAPELAEDAPTGVGMAHKHHLPAKQAWQEIEDRQIGEFLASASQQRQRQSALCANYPTARIRAWRWAGNPICQRGQQGVGHSHESPTACLHRVVVLLGGVRANTCPVGPKLLPWGNALDRGV